MDYKIVEASNAKDLEVQVNVFIKQGWSIVAGDFHITPNNRTDNGSPRVAWIYSQVMVKTSGKRVSSWI